MGLPQVGDDELSSKVVDILIFSFYSNSSLKQRVLSSMLHVGVLCELSFHILLMMCIF